jgi:hypothetical protein
MQSHSCQGDRCNHCLGKVVFSKNKKGIHVDDVLMHDVCWSSRRNLGYHFAKDMGFGIAHVNIRANESVDPLICRSREFCSHCEALGGDVVSGDGSGSWLDVAKFLLCGLKWGGKFAAAVEHGGFSL